MLLLSSIGFGQSNLVLNHSFEEGNNKGIGVQEVKGKGKELENWHSPVRHAPDLYMTPRKSVAVANSGRNAVGLVLGSGRQEKTKYEYLTGKLASPLVKDQAYCICFNTVLQRTSKWAATDVGILLHHDKDLLSDISGPTSMTATLYANDGDPMTNTKWNSYCGYYVASGGEEYISLGKFGTNDAVSMKELGLTPYSELDGLQSKAYYQFDDISVTPLIGEVDCGCAEDEPRTEEEIVNEHKDPPYLFALDASGSMKRDGLFDTLRKNLVHFVDGLPNGTPVSFVTFASSSRKVFAGEKFSHTSNEVDSLLSRASIGGGTNVFVGLQLAYESWSEEGPDSAKMVLISDGEFHVTPKIAAIIKNQYETEGRKLTLIQIGARASGLDQLKPYMDDYIHTTQSELHQVVAQLNTKKRGYAGIAVNCECEEEYSDTMNYHFVIDYSGSMAEEKNRAVMAVRYLYERIPDNAVVSITAFNTASEVLYFGPKAGLSNGQITMMLSTRWTGGGTKPTPGVEAALKLAKKESKNRFSHIILVTDLHVMNLNRARLVGLNADIAASAEEFDLAAHAITIGSDGFVMTHAQYDMYAKKYAGVNRSKFESDLFRTAFSSCDYTSQPYHYNPTKAAMKAGTKKFAAGALKTILNSSLSL
jgi:Mg-chelatase subunit ChlD